MVRSAAAAFHQPRATDGLGRQSADRECARDFSEASNRCVVSVNFTGAVTWWSLFSRRATPWPSWSASRPQASVPRCCRRRTLCWLAVHSTQGRFCPAPASRICSFAVVVTVAAGMTATRIHRILMLMAELRRLGWTSDYKKFTSSPAKAPSNWAVQVCPELIGQASVQVPVVTTSPALTSPAPGHALSSAKKYLRA